MTRKIVLAALLLSMTGLASAAEDSYLSFIKPGKGMICPELDPSSMASGLSLLAAGLVVWRGRKAKNTDNY